VSASGSGDGLRPGTRVVRAGLPAPSRGAPFLPGPTFAAPYHWPGAAGPEGYGRYHNPTWSAWEAALAELEGGEAVAFASGMAAASAVLMSVLRPGDAVVVPDDGYPWVARVVEHELPGVELRRVPSAADAVLGAIGTPPAPRLVWIETPSNPTLAVLDIGAIGEAARAAGALLAVDGTLATPLLQPALALGADVSMVSDTKAMTGHSDLVLGHVAARDGALVGAVRAWRDRVGAVPGPFEAWLAHRSLATLDVRLERMGANARAVAEALEGHPAVRWVRWPGLGPVLAFALAGEAEAEAFLAAATLVDDATSFGGTHTTAERRARWGTDAVGPGFIRFSAGLEATEDLVADVLAALGD